MHSSVQGHAATLWEGSRCAEGGAGGGGKTSMETPAEGVAEAAAWAASVDTGATVIVFAG